MSGASSTTWCPAEMKWLDFKPVIVETLLFLALKRVLYLWNETLRMHVPQQLPT
jgi:hypothetical protein